MISFEKKNKTFNFTQIFKNMAKWQTSTIVPLSAVLHWILWFDDFSNGREVTRVKHNSKFKCV